MNVVPNPIAKKMIENPNKKEAYVWKHFFLKFLVLSLIRPLSSLWYRKETQGKDEANKVKWMIIILLQTLVVMLLLPYELHQLSMYLC